MPFGYARLRRAPDESRGLPPKRKSGSLAAAASSDSRFISRECTCLRDQKVIFAANCNTRPTLAPLLLIAAADASPNVFTPAPFARVCGSRQVVPVGMAPHALV